ncbi:unnamed protein product, partial [Effrenium voratum]
AVRSPFSTPQPDADTDSEAPKADIPAVPKAATASPGKVKQKERKGAREARHSIDLKTDLKVAPWRQDCCWRLLLVLAVLLAFAGLGLFTLHLWQRRLLDEELVRRQSSQVQQLQSELKEAQTETAQLQVQTSELRGLQKTYHAEKEDAEQKVSEVTEELGEETAQVKDLEGKLQAVHATARKLSSALQTDASALRATGASDTRALRSLRLATLSRSQKLEEEDQKLAEEDQQLAERDQKLAEEEQKLAQKEGQIQWLHGKLEEARKKEADLRTQLQSQEEAVRLAKSDAKAKLARASQEALLREKSAEAKTQEQLSSDQTLVQNLLRQLAATSQQRSEGEKHVRQLEEQLQMQARLVHGR